MTTQMLKQKFIEIYGGNETSFFDGTTGWAQIPAGKVITTWDNAKVGVKAGDEIAIPNATYTGGAGMLESEIQVRRGGGSEKITIQDGKFKPLLRSIR